MPGSDQTTEQTGIRNKMQLVLIHRQLVRPGITGLPVREWHVHLQLQYSLFVPGYS